MEESVKKSLKDAPQGIERRLKPLETRIEQVEESTSKLSDL